MGGSSRLPSPRAAGDELVVTEAAVPIPFGACLLRRRDVLGKGTERQAGRVHSAPLCARPVSRRLFANVVSFEKPAAPERIRHTPLVAAKYNRQSRTFSTAFGFCIACVSGVFSRAWRLALWGDRREGRRETADRRSVSHSLTCPLLHHQPPGQGGGVNETHNAQQDERSEVLRHDY